MNNLKKLLIKKIDINYTTEFDTTFFKKLEKEKSRPAIFSKWLIWTVSGLTTASVLFVTIINFNGAPGHSFNHIEYVESVLEIQSTFDEDFIDISVNDLTISPSDEI